jgi:hypothetical protein
MEHHFRFKRGDVELSFSGERDFVEQQVAAYLPALVNAIALAASVMPNEPKQGIEPLIPALDDAKERVNFPRVDPHFKPKRNITLGEFAAMKEATAATDLVVVAGYYMEKYMQQEAYSPAELQRHLREVPSWDCQVVDEVLPLTVLQGYMECLRDERYTLTYKGQSYVREGLS